MGTSASNPGPKGRASLLPPWAPPAPGADAQPGSPADDSAGSGPPEPLLADPLAAPPAGSWTSPRRVIGRLAASSRRGAGARDEVRRAVGGAVRAMGGGRGASRAASAGRSTATGLGGFLSMVATAGLAAAARQFGLAEFMGRGARVFLVRLVDTLAPNAAKTEDVVARTALTATLADLEERLDLEATGLDALDRLTPELMAELMLGYAAHYAYERVLAALADQIAVRSLTPDRVKEIERDAWRYLVDAVRADLPARLPALNDPQALAATRWDGDEGRRIIDQLFTECFAVLEADL